MCSKYLHTISILPLIELAKSESSSYYNISNGFCKYTEQIKNHEILVLLPCIHPRNHFQSSCLFYIYVVLLFSAKKKRIEKKGKEKKPSQFL